ncbi:Cytochrome b2, mitochondrial precursor [Tulasnella sp. 424]|nr:Cytochrome b2, mitochondrial precursor [Tulasnella sp. 424]
MISLRSTVRFSVRALRSNSTPSRNRNTLPRYVALSTITTPITPPPPRRPTTTQKAVTFSLIVAAVLGLFLTSGGPTVVAEDGTNHAKLIPFQEVSKHNKKDDLWVVIRGEVYNLTDFIAIHPGGAKVILQHAGKDTTKIFESIHAKRLLETMLSPSQHIGTVDPATMPRLEPELTDDDIRMLINNRNKPPLGAMINLRDIEEVAKRVMSKKVWHFYRTDAEDGYSGNNFAALTHYFFRPRILREVGQVDTSTSILGMSCDLPIFAGPAAMAGLGHPDGEKNIVKGAGKGGILYGISESTSCSLEEIAAARQPDQSLIYQLYIAKERQVSVDVLRKVENLGFKAVMFTMCLYLAEGEEFDMRARIVADDDEEEGAPPKPKGGFNSASFDQYFDANIGWKDVEWLQASGIDVLLIVVPDRISSPKTNHLASLLAVKYPGVKGILISNHGGRQADYAPAPIDVLYELRQKHPEVFDKVEVYVDGGFRRGTDVVKAVCLGAKAVGLGRPFLYANAAYGERGVSKTIQILREEIINCMQQIGLTNLSQAKPEMIKCMERTIAPPKSSDYSQE